jgi:hypothetical protein
MPVKLSDSLVKLARTEAEAADRSLTAQIEHWAKLGRSVEAALRHEDALALKHGGDDLHRAFPTDATRRAIHSLLRRIATATDRSDLARSLMRGRVVYQSDPDGSGAVMRIDPDGTRVVGRFDRRVFVALRPPRRRVRR